MRIAQQLFCSYQLLALLSFGLLLHGAPAMFLTR